MSFVALLLGLLIALLRGPAPAWVKPWTSRALQAGVVCLGAGIPLDVVWRTGVQGAWMTAAVLAVALTLGLFLARLLGVPRDTALMLSAGTAICGGSAIAAVASVLKPKAEETSVALAIVFSLNALALFLFPPLGHALSMTEAKFGHFAALAIHDTSSVVGASLAYGPTALDVAATMKLARALWIVPVVLVIALTQKRQMGKVAWPYFILGFIAVATLFTYVDALAPLRAGVSVVARGLLLLALFLVGLSLSRDALKKVGVRPLFLGVLLWGVLSVSAFFLSGS